MSGPASTVEIEDLLSSVRRLMADQAAPAPKAPVNDRLVLTPALRVDGPAEQEVPEIVPVPGAELRQSVAPERHAASVETDEAPAPHVPVEEAAETPRRPDTLSRERAARALGILAPDDLPELAAPDAELVPQVADEAAAELEQALSVPDEEAPDMAFAEQSDLGADVVDEVSPQDRHAALEATIAELEQAVLRSSADWEPDGSEAGPGVQPGPESAEAPSPAPVEEAGPAMDPESIGETLLDEEELRALIAEVLREELRGEMGQRVTRNLRKLVRREIYRILAVDELKS